MLVLAVPPRMSFGLSTTVVPATNISCLKPEAQPVYHSYRLASCTWSRASWRGFALPGQYFEGLVISGEARALDQCGDAPFDGPRSADTVEEHQYLHSVRV